MPAKRGPAAAGCDDVFEAPKRLLPRAGACCCRFSKRLPPSVAPENRLDVCAGAALAERVDPNAWVPAVDLVVGKSEGRWVDEGEMEVEAKPVRVNCGLCGAGSVDNGRVCDLLSGVPEPKAPEAAGVELPPKRDIPRCLFPYGRHNKEEGRPVLTNRWVKGAR
jgi:hypothetical protein